MRESDPIPLDGRWITPALGLLRIVTSLLFLEHATSKIFYLPETAGSGPSPWSLLWVAGWVELIGSLMLLLGLFTRPVAFLLAGEMAIGYWTVHAPEYVFTCSIKGESAILFCLIFLLFAATGSGRWSVDVLLGRRPKIGSYHPTGI